MERIKVFLIIVVCVIVIAFVNAEKSCAAREVAGAGRSVVCVCNASYCDELIRQTPPNGSYVVYTTSKAGSRFKITIGPPTTGFRRPKIYTTLHIDPETQYQSIEGFGGAVTDAASINWKNLSDAQLRKYLIDSYFSETGIEYSMLRVPIGGTDFSTHAYAYNDLPENDTMLSNFTLAYEDYEYKIPMIKEIMSTSKTPVHIVSTTWSPPPWMKTNHDYSGFSRLLPQYYQTYADYHYKFLQKYSEEGIPIWGITTTNEPLNGALDVNKFNSLGWTPYYQGKWIANNLGPTIRNSEYKDLKIICVDDQRFTVPVWFNLMVRWHPQVSNYIDGVGVHYYSDFVTPAWILDEFVKSTNKFILATEACEGSFPWQTEKVEMGSWTRAVSYMTDIMKDLTHNFIGWIDWNLCLNEHGGPNWAGNFVDSPIIVFPERGEFVKQPMFYALGHFSKFVPRGSRRIKSRDERMHIINRVERIAFLTPRNTIVVVLYNNYSKNRYIQLEIRNKYLTVKLEAESFTTVELNNDDYKESQ